MDTQTSQSASLDVEQSDSTILDFQHAISINRRLAQAHRRLGLALLEKGDFSLGWLEYEWRYQ